MSGDYYQFSLGKGWYSRYSLKCSVMAHFNARNSMFHRMVILFMCSEHPAAISYQVKPSVHLPVSGKELLPIPPSEVSVSSKKSLV